MEIISKIILKFFFNMSFEYLIFFLIFVPIFVQLRNAKCNFLKKVLNFIASEIPLVFAPQQNFINEVLLLILFDGPCQVEREGCDLDLFLILQFGSLHDKDRFVRKIHFHVVWISDVLHKFLESLKRFFKSFDVVNGVQSSLIHFGFLLGGLNR